jgi:hypothetical protein
MSSSPFSSPSKIPAVEGFPAPTDDEHVRSLLYETLGDGEPNAVYFSLVIVDHSNGCASFDGMSGSLKL